MHRIPIAWLISVLVLTNLWMVFHAVEYRFTWLVVHHSASDRDDYTSIREHHKARGMGDAAYHLILSNGSTEVPAGDLEPTGRFRDLTPSAGTRSLRANLRGLHICIVGNYETAPLPDELIPPLAHALSLLCETFDLDADDLALHRDFNNTACPGKHITKELLENWMEERADECPEEIKRQHEEAVSAASLGLSGYPRGLIAMHAAVTLGLAAVWWLGNRILRRRSRRNRYI